MNSPKEIVDEFNRLHNGFRGDRDCLFIRKLRPYLDTFQLSCVIEAMDNTCLKCFDRDESVSSCQCDNDD